MRFCAASENATVDEAPDGENGDRRETELRQNCQDGDEVEEDVRLKPLSGADDRRRTHHRAAHASSGVPGVLPGEEKALHDDVWQDGGVVRSTTRIAAIAMTRRASSSANGVVAGKSDSTIRMPMIQERDPRTRRSPPRSDCNKRRRVRGARAPAGDLGRPGGGGVPHRFRPPSSRSSSWARRAAPFRSPSAAASAEPRKRACESIRTASVRMTVDGNQDEERATSPPWHCGHTTPADGCGALRRRASSAGRSSQRVRQLFDRDAVVLRVAFA